MLCVVNLKIDGKITLERKTNNNKKTNKILSKPQLTKNVITKICKVTE